METKTINTSYTNDSTKTQPNQTEEPENNRLETDVPEPNDLASEEHFLKRIGKKLDKICARIIGA